MIELVWVGQDWWSNSFRHTKLGIVVRECHCLAFSFLSLDLDTLLFRLGCSFVFGIFQETHGLDINELSRFACLFELWKFLLNFAYIRRNSLNMVWD